MGSSVAEGRMGPVEWNMWGSQRLRQQGSTTVCPLSP